MFCTKCGKKLYDGDSFCAYCGAKVREELMFKTETKPKTRTTGLDEVVFNPPFKAEAERRTQGIEEQTNPYSTEPKRERITLDWNLDGFPSAERKRDDFEINWDAVIEKKRESRVVNVEKILPVEEFKIEEPEMVFEPIREEVKKEEQPKDEVKKEEFVDLFVEEKDEPLSIEDLEKALFGTEDFATLDQNDPSVTVEYKSLKKKEEEFYTFNSKRDAFQELLDKERERIEALENERKYQWNEITPDEEVEYVPKEALKFEEVFREPKLVPQLKEVCVVVPPLTARVMADDPVNIVEPWYQVVLAPLTARVTITEEEECPFQECEVTEDETRDSGEEFDESTEESIIEEELFKEEKTKLRYSDIFPVDAFDTVSDDESGKPIKEEVKKFFDDDEDDDDDEDEKGGHGIIKAIIIILALIIALELVVIGIKFIAPESKVAFMVDGLMSKVTSLFTGEEEPSDEPVINIEESAIEKHTNALATTPSNIGRVVYDAALKYDLSKTYAFDGIAQTSEFSDVAWNGDANKTNGYLIVESTLNYYDSWTANNPDAEIVGINQVTIGEVRTGSSGYYVLNKVIYQGEAGDVIEKTEIVYLEASEDKIIVKEVKEETI